jgi:hypothetical protein
MVNQARADSLDIPDDEKRDGWAARLIMGAHLMVKT